MMNGRSGCKTLAITLLASILLASCEVPDISKFTESSAEMTRGIRRGVNDTEVVIKTASTRGDLVTSATGRKLKSEARRFHKSLEPTLDTLDALDGYLAALNALAEANEKSGENSRAVVDSIGGLVSAVSGFTFASEAINVGAGILTLVEQFRTAQSFKKRVNLAAEILEGRSIAKTAIDSVNGEGKERTYYVKTCNENAKDSIFTLAQSTKKIIDPILAPLDEGKKAELQVLSGPEQQRELQLLKRVSDAELQVLAPLRAKEKRQKLNEWGRLSGPELAAIEAAEQTIGAFGCGVIDFLKFNVEDLKEINLAVSQTLYDSLLEKHQTVTDFQNRLGIRRGDIRRTLDRIQAIHNLITKLSEFIAIKTPTELTAAQGEILGRKVRLKTELDDLFARDPVSREVVLGELTKCGGACGSMYDVLRNRAPRDCDDACQTQIATDFRDRITTDQFDHATAIIIVKLIARSVELDREDDVLAARLLQLKPDYDAAVLELKAIKDKQQQLDSLLATSLTALDAWAEAHANLRVAVNTKQSLSVSKLASKVREIWAIIDASAEE